jgi:hypothetical protein
LNLFDFQIPHVDSLSAALLKYGAALDASDLGTGKTPCALFAAKKLGLRFGVVCLKSGVANWRRTAAEVGVQPSFVINYERLRAGNTGLGKFVDTGKKGESVFVWKIDGPFLIIWDEFHCCKATDSLNSKMALAAKPLFNLMLSATVASSPLEMRALGYLLGLHDGHRGFFQWAANFGMKRGRWNNLIYTGGEAGLLRLHSKIFPEKGARMKVSDLGDRMKDTLISADCYDLDAAGDVAQVYADMQKELEELAKTVEGDKKKSMLTILLRGLQRAELLKVPLFVELAENAVEENASVVIFVNFRASMEAICSRLKTSCVVHGTQSEAERNKAIDDFTADRERVIVVQIKAGGTGTNLNDQHGVHPRVALISPSFSMVTMKQALGRVARVNNKTASIQRIIYAAGTPEEKACTAVRAKIKNLGALTDGDLMAGLGEVALTGVVE